ncbi:MAG TPA: carboxylesterase family protein [Cyclobacteriaceae bacterium]|nr:carboxylesterase family protein [Cyclobacteriaceae bacterium]
MKNSISLLLLITLCVACSKNDGVSTQVKTKAGIVEGVASQTGVISFKGIPFAAPPVGDLRWKEPQAVQPWEGVKKTDAFGPSPMQGTPRPFYMWSKEFLIPDEPISEDCLYLNVWTPAKTVHDKVPVFVWIYGGGFNSGGSAVPIYDGEALASKGIVFVSINYRVNTFGFFAHPGLSKESVHGVSGNYGLLDQIAALKWIQENITAFGGDPSNVTIGGQSAGSMAVVSLVASPLAKGLFNKAIAQSGAGLLKGSPSAKFYRDLGEAETEGAKAAGDSLSVADLRKMTSQEVFDKIKVRNGPIVDGYVLPESLPAIFQNKKENDVALLTGWNEEEGFMFGPPKTAAEFTASIRQDYGADGTELLRYYPANNDAEAMASQLALSRDIIFGGPNYVLANTMSEQGKKVFVYRFTKKVPGLGEFAKFGAFHTGEVPYMMNDLKFSDRPWQPVDHELANTMSTYWVNFVKTGDPNGEGVPEWPGYNVRSKQIINFSDEVTAKSIPDSASLNFLTARLKAQ